MEGIGFIRLMPRPAFEEQSAHIGPESNGGVLDHLSVPTGINRYTIYTGKDDIVVDNLLRLCGMTNPEQDICSFTCYDRYDHWL